LYIVFNIDVSVTPPTCNGLGKYPAAACDQYYECLQFLWWFNLQLKTCPSGQAFNPTLKDCVSAELLHCGASSTSSSTTRTTYPTTKSSTITSIATTVAPGILSNTKTFFKYNSAVPVTPPTCTGSGKYPAPDCTQFYECISVMWWWDYEVKTCPEEQAFDTSSFDCTSVALIKCKNTITTTTLKINTMTTRKSTSTTTTKSTTQTTTTTSTTPAPSNL
jgi:hypothetical protein